MRLPAFRHLYYYVPPCPRCGSRRTGRYIREPFTGAGFTKEESMKNGELVRFAPEDPVNNGYCASCGHEWPVRVETRWLTYAQIHQEQIARGTEPLYEKIEEQKGDSKWDLGRRYRKHCENMYAEEAGTVPENKPEPELIDARKRDRIELLYADEPLLAQVKNVQRSAQ